MLGYFITAVSAFCCGFLAAGLLAAGRRHDSARGEGLLADEVAQFTADYDDRRFDVGNRVAVARGRLEQLERALAVRDELGAS